MSERLPILSLIDFSRIDSDHIGQSYLSLAFTEDPIERTIRAIGRLPEGWEFGRGRPSPAHVVNAAIAFYRDALTVFRLAASEVAPGSEGAIVLTYEAPDDTFIDVTVNLDLSYDWRIEKGVGVNYDVEHEDEDVSAMLALVWLKHRIPAEPECALQETFTPTDIHPVGSGSARKHFTTTEMTSPFFTWSVPLTTPPKESVNILIPTTQRPLEPLLFFGSSAALY